MDFDLTEEQNLTRQAVRDFAEKEKTGCKVDALILRMGYCKLQTILPIMIVVGCPIIVKYITILDTEVIACILR